jgi:signal transduction histidine kinase
MMNTNSGLYLRNGHLRPGEFRGSILAGLVWVCSLFFVASVLHADQDTNTLGIQSVSVSGKSVSFHGKDAITLGSSPQNIVFSYGPDANASRLPLRLRYKLEGYDSAWHEASDEMAFNVRFYNHSGDQINRRIYSVRGESTGWTGSLNDSSLTHRRETLLVPPGVARFAIAISSAGPPDTVGIYVVANLTVSKSFGGASNVVLRRSPFEDAEEERATDSAPAGWVREGGVPSMAKIVKFGQDPQTRAFAIVDDDPLSHAECHSAVDSGPAIKPGDHLVVEWNEMYSTGSGSVREATYNSLPAGHYVFRVRAVDVMGLPTGTEASMVFSVRRPFWKVPWFWGVAVIAITVMAVGVSRYFIWHRLRREVARIKQQQLLERERLRIAHDIHDDLGARITQISLLSAMSQKESAFPEKARKDFDKISNMSRELVSALYETVWAVNPENDNLEALGNYLCQIVEQLCERTALRCRLHVMSLPHDVQVSSQTRHNLSMCVKEAVHNIVKHAGASEVAINMAFSDGLFDVSIHDNGLGFETAAGTRGHGLNNMKRRLQNIGGECLIESTPRNGTTVRLRLKIQPIHAGSRNEL